MASQFDAVRRRKQGEEAKERVYQRLSSPPAAPERQSSMFDGVRNRSIDTKPDIGTPMPELQEKYGSVTPMNLVNAALYDATVKNQQAPKNKSDVYQTEYDKGLADIEASGAPAPIKAYAKGMNWLTHGNPVGNFFSRIGHQADSVMSGGNPVTIQPQTGNKVADVAADITGSVASVFTPTGAPMNMGPIAGTYGVTDKVLTSPLGMKAEQAAANQLSKLIKPQTAQALTREGLREGAAGAMQGAAFGAMTGQDDAGILRDAALGGGIGGALGMGFRAAGIGLSKLFKQNGIPESEIAEILALPEGRKDTRLAAAADRSNLPIGTDPIANPYTFSLPEATPPTRAAAASADEARLGLREVDNAINDLNLKYEQRVIDEYKLLKEARDAKGTKPQWYREFYSTNNKRPSNKDLYELARERVGFDNEQLSGLMNSRDGLQSSLRQVDPTLHVTDQPLVNKELRDIRVAPGQTSRPYSPPYQPVRPGTTKLELRRQEINNRLSSGGNLTSDDIDYILSSEPSPVRSDDFSRVQKNPLELTKSEPIKVNKEVPVNPIQEAEEIVQSIQQPRIRDRVYNFLDEQEAAARKRINSRRNRLSANPLDEWADHSIIMAAKLGKGTIKAADFTEELVKEFGENIRPHADQIFKRTKEVLRQNERRASKEGKEALSYNEQGVGDADTFKDKISKEIAKSEKPWNQRWERIRTQFSDDLAPLESLEKRVRGELASAEDSLYKAARLFKGTPERANQIVQQRLTPVIQAVERSGYTADDLGMYALAKHAKDVNAAGYKSGFTNQEIESVLQRYGTPEMDEAQQMLVQINKDMLQELVDSGVVSKNIAEVLNERWENYIPLFRSMDDNKVEFGRGMSSALANVASPIKALKGSEKRVVDPLENMVKNIFQSVDAAERNNVARQLEKLAKLDPDANFIRKLDPDEQVGRKNVVNVKVDGENVKYEVEPEVYKALLNLDKESSNMLINILSKPASLLRAGATLTPEFSLRNPMRDVVQAFITSKNGFNPITDFTAGLIQSIKKGPLYREWIDNLGAYGNVLSMDRQVHRQALERVLKEPASKKFVNIVNGKGFINLLRAISDTTESATKVGEYRAGLRKGLSKREAAYQSRDVMDFARAGSSVRQANKIVAFLNANIQGKSKLIRAVKENPVGVTARAFASVTLPTIGFYVFNDRFSNDEQRRKIDNAPDWMRDTFWLVSIPGTDAVARIPKPFDVAPLFANLPERALQFVQEKDPEAFDGFVRRSLGDLSLPVQITGLWPFIEGMSNYSFFREGSIVPQREQGLEWSDQYDPIRTTETAKLLAAGAEKLTGGEGMFKNFSSPRIMDNTIQGLTAGLGRYATDSIDAILDGLGVVDRPTKPDKTLEQLPVFRAFLVDPEQGGKAMDKFYERREELSKKKASAKLNQEPFEQVAELKMLDKTSEIISNINKRIREIERGEGTGAEKRRQIEPLIKQRNELVQQSLDRLKEKR